VQIVFQNALAALDPRQRVEAAIAKPLQNLSTLSSTERKARVNALLDESLSGLDAAVQLQIVDLLLRLHDVIPRPSISSRALRRRYAMRTTARDASHW